MNSLTDLRELFDPHPRLELHVLHVQVLGIGGGAVGELHLHGHHVCVGAERLPAEAVLHRQALPGDAVQQLVVLQGAGGRDGLQVGGRRGDDEQPSGSRTAAAGECESCSHTLSTFLIDMAQ